MHRQSNCHVQPSSQRANTSPISAVLHTSREVRAKTRVNKFFFLSTSRIETCVQVPKKCNREWERKKHSNIQMQWPRNTSNSALAPRLRDGTVDGPNRRVDLSLGGRAKRDVSLPRCIASDTKVIHRSVLEARNKYCSAVI